MSEMISVPKLTYNELVDNFFDLSQNFHDVAINMMDQLYQLSNKVAILGEIIKEIAEIEILNEVDDEHP